LLEGRISLKHGFGLIIPGGSKLFLGVKL